MDPEIRHLRAICAIAEAGSLSQAAARLGVSQPGLTALLQRLERSVGGQLFVRSRAGVKPTALGERALQRARLVLAELDAFAGELARSAAPQQTVRLGSVHMECVGTLLERVREALPETEITLQVEPSGLALAQSLANDRLDVAVVGMMDDRHVPLSPSLGQRTLVPRAPVFVALAASHPLAPAATVDLADLAEESWIRPPGADDGSLASLREACLRAGFAPRLRYEAPSGAGRQLIETGQAVQLVEPASTGRGGLAIRPLTGEPLHMRLVVAWRQGRLSEQDVNRIYQSAARAYTEHALRSPTYARWWVTHPEVHPMWT